MRLAIADPPYLGRGRRHYAPGASGRLMFGSGPARRATGRQDVRAQTTEHPDAAMWDDPDTHRNLVDILDRGYDGWAIAAHPTSLPVYLAAAPDAHVAVWVNTRALPGGARVYYAWEPVLLRIPPDRIPRGSHSVRDTLLAAPPNVGHTGAKPVVWCRWVLDMLGYDPDTDTLTDMFPGSGVVRHVAAQETIAP